MSHGPGAPEESLEGQVARWRRNTTVAAQELERQGLALIGTANLLRAELGLDCIRVSHIARAVPRKHRSPI